MKLIEALRIDPKTKLSLVGSGGKSSALIQMGREWSGKALIAATAHIGLHQLTDFPDRRVLVSGQNRNMDHFSGKLVVTGPGDKDFKLSGIDPSLWNDLLAVVNENEVPIFIESDGSKTRPLKAPASYEPAIPDWINHVVVSVGLSAVGKILNDQNVHRPEIFSSITGLEIGKPVTLHSIVKMLTHPLGGLKNIPRLARRTVLFNQLDTLEDTETLPMIEKQLLEHYDSVVTTALDPNVEKEEIQSNQKGVVAARERIACIILAAGNSKRMGQPKALLLWKNLPFVRQCALHAISAGLSPIHIIAGNEFEKIRAIVSDLPVEVLFNSDWNEGQSCSIRVGIKSLPKRTGAAIFMLVDQPHIPVSLLVREKNEHAKTLAPIILPVSGGRRANPVLFDRRTFAELTNLHGDVGGRIIFSRFQIQTIPWFDESILLDVDTPEDYEHLMEIQ